MPLDSLRLRARTEHRALRRRIGHLEATASAVAEGLLPRGLLDVDLHALHDALERHLAWEDRNLATLVPGTPADREGRERVDRTRAVHGELEAVLALCAGEPGCRGVPTAVACQRALALASLLREEIADEERRLQAEEPCLEHAGAGAR